MPVENIISSIILKNFRVNGSKIDTLELMLDLEATVKAKEVYGSHRKTGASAKINFNLEGCPPSGARLEALTF